jgi:hypothetical protein
LPVKAEETKRAGLLLLSPYNISRYSVKRKDREGRRKRRTDGEREREREREGRVGHWQTIGNTCARKREREK